MSQAGIFSSGGGGGTVTSVTGGTGINITGTATDPIVNLDVPVSIADGGTNATSFATTDGTIYYDGTRLVTTATGTANFVLTSNGAGVAPTYQAVSSSGAITSVTGGNNITITGTATAPIVNVSGTTNHAVQVGNSTNSLTSLGVGTNGQVLLGATTSDPSWVTPTAGSGLSITTNSSTLAYAINAPVSIANGGTNATSMANTDGVIYYDGTRLVTTAVGTATNVLTSNGAGVAPTFQAIPASGVTSISGDTGGAQTGAITLTGGSTGASFGGSAGTITMTFAGITANGGTVNLATDATTSAINVGTGAGVKTTIIGSTNSTSTTTVQSGSGALNVTATGGALTINSGVGALGISTDASATTISIGTGGAVKGVTLGSTNTSSSLALKSGSGNIIANTGFTVNSSGINTNTKQPAFLAYLATTQTNTTGAGGNYQVPFSSTTFDVASNFNTGTGTFTASVTGKYYVSFNVQISGMTAAHTDAYLLISKNTFSEYPSLQYFQPFVAAGNPNTLGMCGSFLLSLTAGDTLVCTISVGGGTNIISVTGNSSSLANGYPTAFCGYLAC